MATLLLILLRTSRAALKVIFVQDGITPNVNAITLKDSSEIVDVFLFDKSVKLDSGFTSYSPDITVIDFMDFLLASLDNKKEVFIVNSAHSYNEIKLREMSRHHFYNEKSNWLYLCASIRNKLRNLELSEISYSAIESSIIKHLS